MASSVRHFQMSVIVVLQNLSNSIPVIMKENASVAFLTKVAARSLKSAFEMNSHFTKQQDFADYLQKETKNFGVVRLEVSSGLEPSITSWMKPAPNPKEQFVLKF